MQRNTFSLTPRRIPIERKASSAKREVDQDMGAKEERASECGSDTDSGWSGVSDTVGGLGSEGDKTVIPGPKYWNPISSSKCIVLARQD